MEPCDIPTNGRLPPLSKALLENPRPPAVQRPLFVSMFNQSRWNRNKKQKKEFWTLLWFVELQRAHLFLLSWLVHFRPWHNQRYVLSMCTLKDLGFRRHRIQRNATFGRPTEIQWTYANWSKFWCKLLALQRPKSPPCVGGWANCCSLVPVPRSYLGYQLLWPNQLSQSFTLGCRLIFFRVSKTEFLRHHKLRAVTGPKTWLKMSGCVLKLKVVFSPSVVLSLASWSDSVFTEVPILSPFRGCFRRIFFTVFLTFRGTSQKSGRDFWAHSAQPLKFARSASFRLPLACFRHFPFLPLCLALPNALCSVVPQRLHKGCGFRLLTCLGCFLRLNI